MNDIDKAVKRLSKVGRYTKLKILIYGHMHLMDGRWCVGCTMYRNRKVRLSMYKRGKSGCKLFDDLMQRYIMLDIKYEDVFQYVELHSRTCTRHLAYALEISYQNKLNSIHPNGFNSTSGGYSVNRFAWVNR